MFQDRNGYFAAPARVICTTDGKERKITLGANNMVFIVKRTRCHLQQKRPHVNTFISIEMARYYKRDVKRKKWYIFTL